MKKLLLLASILLCAGSENLCAERIALETSHKIDVRSQIRHPPRDGRSRLGPPAGRVSHDIRSRLKLPARLPLDADLPDKPAYRGHPGEKSARTRHARPRRWWPVITTIQREVQPIVIVTPPLPAEPVPPPEPEKVWVPPVMDTRTEPGYWDFEIKKVWMGDHWRYEQDLKERTWVPATQVEFVKQAGYWR